MSGFTRFNLSPFLIKSLQTQNIAKPMEIQERLIPAILNGKDVIGQSQTGSGKTLAYLLPILTKIDPEKNYIQAIITAPTRELAEQIYQESQKLLGGEDTPSIRVKRVTGGIERSRTVTGAFSPHVIVATPGRLKDVAQSQMLDVHQAKMLVVDEADQMLDMGFIEDIDPIAALMPDDLQMLVFSATIPESLQPFLQKYMNAPKHAHVKPREATPASITHHFIPLKHRDRTEVTVQLSGMIRPYLAIIFTSTKEDADLVFDEMIKAGFQAEVLHGGLPPRQRKQVMRRLRSLEVQYLVATDLAARGMDIEGVSHVINHSLPSELEYYIHRVGRSARAGETGEAFTFVEKDEYPVVRKLKDKGIPLTFSELKKDGLSAADIPWRNRSWQKGSEFSPQIPKRPKKIKPGYKKKAKRMMEQEQRKRNKRK
ncbi:DEAD/DEAH box helicase [Alteribacillus iranensis]|uniref:ATP-dependent RNA helicase CshB n=1 Tax=Alteribacillus iranensis TaxID=930128 RepID=A0A1I1ZDG2_9BACI|nr:DEAD/DEAH box helicase [Alteribacillus iranensis]SFE29368.1 ATP-dependent RNA helicase CshB [Alteribacillus iranensis]